MGILVGGCLSVGFLCIAHFYVFSDNFQDLCLVGASSSLLNMAAPSLSLIPLSTEGESILVGLFLGLSVPLFGCY